jgi:hypothetical protein
MRAEQGWLSQGCRVQDAGYPPGLYYRSSSYPPYILGIKSLFSKEYDRDVAIDSSQCRTYPQIPLVKGVAGNFKRFLASESVAGGVSVLSPLETVCAKRG